MVVDANVPELGVNVRLSVLPTKPDPLVVEISKPAGALTITSADNELPEMANDFSAEFVFTHWLLKAVTLPTTMEGLADGTSSPVDNNVAAPKPVKLICPNCVEVNPELLVPTNILPAVPEDPAVPLHPLMVRIFAEVQPTPLLAEKTRL